MLFIGIKMLFFFKQITFIIYLKNIIFPYQSEITFL